MTKRLGIVLDWIFGGTTVGTIGMWWIELVKMFQFEYWIKIGVGLIAIMVGLMRIYDWTEKKCRRYKKLKNGTNTK